MFAIRLIKNSSKSCIYSRILSTCSNAMNKYGSRESRFLGKMLRGSSGNKRKWYSPCENTQLPTLPTPVNLTKGANEGVRSRSQKRVTVLNKAFMRYITDIMATGEYSMHFLGRGLEISRVKIANDFKMLNVYWVARGCDDDEEMEKILKKFAGPLRHELSQLRVMGEVPKLTFVKDKKYAAQYEVDFRLAKADFGEDYTPVDPSYRIKSEFVLNSNKLKSKTHKEDTIDEEEPLPPMKMDVLGLNQGLIMAKIKASLKKTQKPHNILHSIEDRESHQSETISNAIAYPTCKSQREAFEQFLHTREIARLKAKKDKKEKCPIYLEQTETDVLNDDYKDIDDCDYIEEDKN